MGTQVFQKIKGIFRAIRELVNGLFLGVLLPPLLLLIASVFFLPLSAQFYFLFTSLMDIKPEWLVFLFSYCLFGLGVVYSGLFILLNYFLVVGMEPLIENGLVDMGNAVYGEQLMLFIIGIHIDWIIWGLFFSS